MFIYIIFIAIEVLFAYMSQKIENERPRKIFTALTILFPAIIAGIRYKVGTDYVLNYEPFFIDVANSEGFFVNSRFEIGYELINIIVAKLLNMGFPVVTFICSLITIGFVYLALKKFKNEINVVVAMTVFMLLYYQMSFNIVRQLMAIAIIFYAISILKESKLKYFLLVIFASAFHITSLIMLIVPIIEPILVNKKYRILKFIMLALFLVVIFNYKYIYSMLENVSFLRHYVISYLVPKESGIGIGIIVRSLPFLLPFICLDKKGRENKTFLLMYYLFIIGSMLRVFTYITTTYAERIALYFTFSQIYLVGYYIKNMIKFRKTISVCLLSYTIFLWYYDFIMQNMHETIPYTTIFQIIG